MTGPCFEIKPERWKKYNKNVKNKRKYWKKVIFTLK
jgi:hypothetical protein